MPRVPLQFGTGLDRDAGYGIDSPRMRDVRNVYLRNGRVELRKGHTSKSTLAGAAEIVGGTMLRAAQIGVVASVSAAGEVSLWRTDGLGGGAALLGSWFTLEPSALDPPRIIAAESDIKAFFAHDEARVSKREGVVYHDPFETNGIVPLLIDFGVGEGPVRFRGVVSHLEYVVGWGFGTEDEDRPELVRISLPGEPTNFDPMHYLVIGARGDAVLSCVPLGTGVGSSLLVFKGSETHHIFGTHRANFGSQLLDPRVGVAASRLAINVGGAVFVWSEEGPRVFTGARAGEDISLPLDLKAPAPADLVAAGETENAFAIYIPDRQCVEFRFGARVYKLHLAQNPPQWTYEEVGFSAKAGFLLYQGEIAPSAPLGFPTLNSSNVLSYHRVTLTVGHTNADGDEILETWVRPAAGGWVLKDARDVSGQLVTQEVDLTGLVESTTYDVALRYRRGPYYTAGYEGSNPALWPSYDNAAFTTPASALALTSAVWSRTSAVLEKIVLTFVPADVTEAVEIYRINGIVADPDDGTPVLIATVLAGETTYENWSIDDAFPISGETDYTYFVKHAVGNNSNVIDVWVGPLIQTVYCSVIQFGSNAVTVQWRSPSVPGGPPFVGDVEVWLGVAGALEADTLRATVPNCADPFLCDTDVTIGAQTPGYQVPGKVRFKLTSFTVVDYSRFTVEDLSAPWA